MAIAIPLLFFLPAVLKDGLVAFARPSAHALVGLAIGAAFALLAIFADGVLALPNRLWHRLGLLLGRIVAPIVMGIVFFAVVTPIALVRRALGQRSLATAFEPAAESYWVERDPPGPEPGQLPRQF